MTDLGYLVASTILTWIMLVTASVLRSRGWNVPGLRRALGNRDDLEEPTPMAARADRAAKNMLENLVLFAALLLAARAAGGGGELAGAAAIFFWARVAYFPVYLAGIRYVRTAFWAISLVGLAQLAHAALGRG